MIDALVFGPHGVGLGNESTRWEDEPDAGNVARRTDR